MTRSEAETSHGRRQLVVNPLFVTATGGTLASGATGSVPANWVAGPNLPGPVCAISTEASPLGNSVVTDVAFTAADQYARLAQTISTDSWQAGDVVQLVADVEIVTPGPLAALFGIIQSDIGGTARDSFSMLTAASGTPMAYLAPQETCRYTLMTRPWTIPSGAKNLLSIGVRGSASGAGNARWKVHQLALVRRDNAY